MQKHPDNMTTPGLFKPRACLGPSVVGADRAQYLALRGVAVTHHGLDVASESVEAGQNRAGRQGIGATEEQAQPSGIASDCCMERSRRP